jgi:hypothetical protein
MLEIRNWRNACALGQDGKPLQSQSLTREFQRLHGGLEDLPGLRLHDLRYSQATQLLETGVPAKVASRAFDSHIYARRYRHVTPTVQEKAVESPRRRMSGEVVGPERDFGRAAFAPVRPPSLRDK